MEIISIVLIFVLGVLYGRLLKSTVNWLNIDGFQIDKHDLKMELFCIGSWYWGAFALQPMEGTIFALLAGVLFAVSWIDFHTYQIPLLFVIVGSVIVIFGVISDVVTLKSAIYGVLVGSVIPLTLIGLTYLITKRQGMGYGDIQLGFVCLIWLGPVRMALTLFGASLLSLIPDKTSQTIKLNSEAPNSVRAILTGPSQIKHTKPSCISPYPIPCLFVIKYVSPIRVSGITEPTSTP
jgi:prepilin signal peptidase PulO-like enzyme (type II secretory pathway)